MQALLRNVRRELIDVMQTYKIDRISRSVHDFYQFWSVLEAHDVIFVSATQAFNTTTPAGILGLNVPEPDPNSRQ